MTTTYTELATSALGVLTLTATEAGLTGIYLEAHRHAPTDRSAWIRDPAPLESAVAQLTEYLAGRRRAFDLPLAPPAGTPFQRRVWAALEVIAYGTTTTYGALAAALGVPRAVRAVGAANGRSRSCAPATASSAWTARSRATAAAWRPSGRCSRSRRDAGRRSSGSEGSGVGTREHELGRGAARCSGGEL